MTDPDVEAKAIVTGLTKAQARALSAMSAERQYPGKSTFTSGAAWGLSWITPRLVERVNVLTATERSHRYRDAYFATPLGLRVKHLLESQSHDKGEA